MKGLINPKGCYSFIVILLISINYILAQEVSITYTGSGATLPSTGTINQGVKITFTDADIINNFYTQGQSEIYIYAGVDTNVGHWQFKNATAINVADLDPMPIVLHDDPATLTNTYSIIIDPKVFFDSIPDGTTVYGIDFLLVNQFGAGGNNQTANFYIDLVDAAFSAACVPGLEPYDDQDCDGVYNIQDLDDDNDGILDINEQIMACDALGFDFSNIQYANIANIPSNRYLFQNRLLTTNNTIYPGTTFSLQVIGWSGTTGTYFPDIRGNNRGDLALSRENGKYVEVKLTFSQPINFLMNEDEVFSGNTAISDQWTFTLPDYDSSYFTHSDPGIPDIIVNSETAKSINLNFLGNQQNPADDNWEFHFYNVTEITLRFDSSSSDNTSILSMTPCDYLDIDTDGDGIPDHLDTDSDNDGCPDVIEAGHSDSNSDRELDGTGVDPLYGIVTGYTTGYTGNAAAVIDDSINSNCCDTSLSGALDTDGDGVANSCDIDDDNDGILDSEEGFCSSTSTFVWPIPDTDVPGNSPYAFNDVNITASLSMVNPADSYTYSATGTNGTFQGWRIEHNNQNSGDPIVATLNFDSPITIKNFSIGDIDGGSSSVGGPANNNELITVDIKLSDGSSYLLGTSDFVAGSQVIYLGNNQFKGTEGGSPQNDPMVVLTIIKEIEMVQSIEVSYTMANLSGNLTGYIILFNDLKKCDNTDTDGDGIPNYLDLDSDADGCPDSSEMGVTAYISDNNINITQNDIAGTGTNGIPSGTTINRAQIDIANGGDTVGPNNGFHDLLESGSTGVFAGTYLDPAEYYLNPSASNCVCYKYGTGPAVLSKVGISTRNRHVNQDLSHWPEDVPGGYLVLDSKEKPFVITRMTTAEIDAVANPVEGMMAYDSTLDCLKLYDGEGWICIEQTCDQ